MTEADVQRIALALVPLLSATIKASIDEAVRRGDLIRPVPGTISSVSGPDVRVEPDDAPGTFVEATQTASGQVAGARTIVLTFGNGASFCFGVIP
jgi:hypothetical protein